MNEIVTSETEIEPFASASWYDGTRGFVVATRRDGTREIVPADHDDPRFDLIVNGDPQRGIAPLTIAEQELDEARIIALDILDSWEAGKIHQALEYAGRRFRIDAKARLEFRIMSMDAARELKLRQPWSGAWEDESGQVVTIAQDDAIGIGRALSERERAIRHWVAQLRRELQSATTREALARALKKLG